MAEKVRAQHVRAQMCLGTNLWAQMCVGTNVCGHNRVWAQTCLGTIVCGHNQVWAQSSLGTIVSGHNRVWAQSCLGTIVSGHNRVWAQSCVGTIVWAQSCMGPIVVEPLIMILSAALNVTPVNKPLISLGLNRPVDGCSVDLTLMLPSADYVNVNMFCLPSLNLSMCVEGLAKYLNELRDNNVPISPNVPHYKNDTVKICGILGNDVLSMFKVFFPLPM